MTFVSRFFPSAVAAAGLALTAAPASAGWNNVFEACCWDCNKRSSYKPPECPQPERRVQYIQRTYYETVTEYKCEKILVPQQYSYKSYYWEPVTSYKYSSYYDPCSGECQKVATPVQSYALREQCNSATRYVERTRTVPVTAYRPVTVTQPVVTYYMPPIVQRSSYSIPVLPQGANTSPNVEMFRSNPPAATEERGGPETLIPKTNVPTTDPLPRAMPGNGTSRVNTASRGPAKVIGEVVEKDRVTPRAGVKVVFVNAANPETREYTTANEFGEFETKLPAGEWFVYLGKGDGKAAYHSKIAVLASQPRNLKVVGQ